MHETERPEEDPQDLAEQFTMCPDCGADLPWHRCERPQSDEMIDFLCPTCGEWHPLAGMRCAMA
jgi:predicted RNA-binding Zn-ribbon protein involved in translation (DUF1610 family)